MLIKKKSILVIVLSSALISLVLVVTLIGSYLYLNWKSEADKDAYFKALYELHAKLYAKYISISSVLIKLDDEGLFQGKPIVEGHIKNKSNKKITALKLKITLLDKNGKVLYMDIFYPIQSKPYLSVISRKTGTYLAPNDSVSFKHLLKNCPKDIYTYLKMKTRFAKERRKEKLNISYNIVELSLK